MTIADDQPADLVSLLQSRAARAPGAEAFIYLEDGESHQSSLTYAGLDLWARRIAAHLEASQAGGQRALLLFPPGLEFISAYFGCLYAGVVAVPVYPPRLNRPAPRIQAIAADCQARFALTTSAILANIEKRFEHAPELAALEWINTQDIPEGIESGWQDPQVHPDALAFLQYTSGSTAAPKGVMIRHANLLYNMRMIRQGFQIDPQGRGVFWLPNYHDMGLIGGILEPLFVGGTSILMSPVSFLQRPIRWLQAISNFRGTISGAPNFAFDLCVDTINAQDRQNLDLSSLGLMFTGAEPIRPQTLERFAAAFAECGFRRSAFYPCYGLAETTLLAAGGMGPAVPAVLTLEKRDLEEHLVRPVAPDSASTTETVSLVGCGGELLEEKIRIVDPERESICKPGTIGEIWVDGPHVSPGYWGRAEETRQSFGKNPIGEPVGDKGEAGFFRTGDLGFSHQGQLYITGRLKDLIIIRGRNHYPQDIELTVEKSHQALQPAAGAAFSVETDGSEQLVVVHELTRAGRRSDLEEVVAAIRRAIAEFHDLQLAALTLVKPLSIPKTTSGKIRRQETRRRYLEGRLRLAHLWRPSEADAVRQKVLDPAAADPQSPQIAAGDGAAERIEAKIVEAPPSLSRYLAGSASAAQRMEIGKSPGSQAPPKRDPIAIIGMGVRFPGADGPEAFWKLLAEGRDAVSEVPADRFDADSLYDSELSAGKMTTRWGAFLSEVDRFDAAFFGISPREAARMDPQQRIFLEVSWEALEHAGQSPEALRGTAAGVFVGVSSYDYSGRQFSDMSQIDAYAGTGNAHSIVANRLSYFLDLRGPSLAIDTACSSSLVAVHQGVQSLRAGESDLVLAGGVNLILSPELTITFSQARMMAADGRCKTFDGRADGYVRGEGCGVVVLKRLADAIRDNDSIHALILGSAVNQDGRSNGLTAPNGQAQRAVIQAALEQAGISGDEVEYVEAHGTGTPLGDPIEIAALRSVLEPHPERARPLLVGSVKTNIGHLEAAAGIAGLIKAALMLGRGQVPANLHFESLNPYIDLGNSAIQIPTTLRPWPGSTGSRLAGVSSFGFGGTNAHMILSQAGAVAYGDASASSSSTSDPGARLPILTLAAPGKPGLLQLAERYQDRLSAIESFPEWADLAYTSNAGRVHFAQRIAVAAPSARQARDRLAGLVASLPDRQPASSPPRVAFLFSGQGAQYVGMGRQLYASEPGFREVFDECAHYLSMDPHRPLQELIWPAKTSAGAHPRALPDTRIAQPALFALEYALARLWSSWGIQPDVLIGHSIGEYAAACLAGIFTLPEACKLVAARGRLMAGLPAGGGMAAVFASASEIEPLIAPFADRISIAAENGPRTVVISGALSALEVIVSRLQEQSVEYRWLDVSHAFHSPLVEPVLSQFRQIAGEVDFRPADIPLISNLRGQLLEPEEIPDADYWVDHIREPVLFARGVDALIEQEVQVCVEIGPWPVLLGMARHCVDAVQRDQISWLASLREGEADQEVMANALAVLYERGASVDWNAYHRGSQRKKRLAPTYPFQRQRYWVEGRPVRRAPAYEFRRVMQVAIPVLECQVPHLGQSGMVGLILDAVRQACEIEDPGLESIQFERQAARPGRVQVLVTPSGDRATFQLFGRDGEGDWIPLAGGAATWAPETQGAGPGSPAAKPLLTAHSQQVSEISSASASHHVRTIASDAPAGQPAPDRGEQTPAGGGAGVGTDRLELYLRQRAAAALGLSDRRIRATDRLDMLGLDSLMAVELRNALEKDLNIRLPVARFLSGATISELARAGQDLLADSRRDETASSIPLGDELGSLSLTHDQQAMWLLDQLMPEDITFNVSGAVRLRGPFDLQLLRTSLERIMARHAMLRARFEVVDGEPAQIISADLPVPYAEIDARSWDQAQLGLQLRSDAYRPFAMEWEPAWRMVMYDLADEDRILLVAMQHTITDFWSMTIFAAELMAIYRAVRAGRKPDLPAIPVKFTDFVRWERENLQSRQGQEHLAYWKQ